jgi:hypothetical protein
VRRLGMTVLVGILGVVVGLTIGFTVGRLSRLINPAWLEAIGTWLGGLFIAIAVTVVAVALFSIPNPIRRLVTRFFTSGARARLRWSLYGLLVAASFSLMVIIPLLESDDSTSAKVGDGVRTGVVVLALTVAVATYLSNSRNKRIEQVYDFHKELTVGDIGEARIRLSRLIYSQERRDVDPPLLREISRSEVREGTLTYREASEHKPDYDWTLLIRFFERVWNAQRQRSLDDLAVARLIGGHARWWDLALDAEKDTRTRDEVRRALSEFAQWASRYQEEHPDEPRLGDWGDQLERTFGKSKRDPVPPPAGRRLSWFRRDITQ